MVIAVRLLIAVVGLSVIAVRLLWLLSSLLRRSLLMLLPFILLAIGFTLGRRAVSRLMGTLVSN